MTESHAPRGPVNTNPSQSGPRELMRAIATDPRLTPLAFRVLYTLSAIASRDSFTAVAPQELARLLDNVHQSRGVPRALGLLELHGYLVPASVYCPATGTDVHGVRVTRNLTQLKTLTGGLPATLTESSARHAESSARSTRGLGPSSRTVHAELSDCPARALGPPRARVENMKTRKGGKRDGADMPAAIAADVAASAAHPPPFSASPGEAPGRPAELEARDDRSRLIQAVRTCQGGLCGPQESEADHDLAEGILEQRMPAVDRRAHLEQLLELVAFAGGLEYFRRRLTLELLARQLSPITGELRDKLAKHRGNVVPTDDPAAVAAAAALKAERGRINLRRIELTETLWRDPALSVLVGPARDRRVLELVSAQLALEFPPPPVAS